ncbi:MAG: NTP transferase domain-containing protein [Thermoplasmata archaeon]
MELGVVVLAGGRSRRFGRDKLQERIDGRPILGRVLDAVLPLGPTALSTRSLRRGRELSRATPTPISLLRDRPGPGITGPPAAIVTALRELPFEELLFVPGDVPWIRTEALREFVRLCRRNRAVAGTLRRADGGTDHLIQFHRRRASVPAALRIARLRHGDLRASDLLRGAPRVVYVPLDRVMKDPSDLDDVDRPEDLIRASRGPGRSPRPGRSQVASGGPQGHFLEGLRAVRRNDRPAAFRHFAEEGGWYHRAGIELLELHCWEDAARVDPIASVRTGLPATIAALCVRMGGDRGGR